MVIFNVMQVIDLTNYVSGVTCWEIENFIPNAVEDGKS